MDEDAGAFDMAQELVTQANTFVRSLDEAWQVCHDEGVESKIHDAEHGLKGCKREVSYIRHGVRDGPQQRRFAGVGQPNETNIREQLQLEAKTEAPAQAGHARQSSGA